MLNTAIKITETTNYNYAYPFVYIEHNGDESPKDQVL